MAGIVLVERLRGSAATPIFLGFMSGLLWAPACLIAQSPTPPEAAVPPVVAPVQGGPASPSEHPNRKIADPLLAMIRTMTPEQKTQLMENLKAWQQVSPDLKQVLRNKEAFLRKKFKDEVDAALGDVQISSEQRAVFEERYREERKKIDTALRVELEARRRASLEEIVQRLKKNLEPSNAPVPSANPSTTSPTEP